MSPLANHLINYRVTFSLSSGVKFIIICDMPRFIEGFGTSLYNTTIITLLAHLCPDTLGTSYLCKWQGALKSEKREYGAYRTIATNNNLPGAN
jgi:hypothetical protein